MTQRKPATPAPGSLEAYSQHFDALFVRHNQRESFRRYLEGLLLPAERNTTLTAIANTEPIVGAQRPRAHALQWLLSEADWEPAAGNARRLDLLRADPVTTPDGHGALVIDEHGDRKRGTKTAHIGKHYRAHRGKVATGVVSVSSLWTMNGSTTHCRLRPPRPRTTLRGAKPTRSFGPRRRSHSA